LCLLVAQPLHRKSVAATEPTIAQKLATPTLMGKRKPGKLICDA